MVFNFESVTIRSSSQNRSDAVDVSKTVHIGEIHSIVPHQFIYEKQCLKFSSGNCLSQVLQGYFREVELSKPTFLIQFFETVGFSPILENYLCWYSPRKQTNSLVQVWNNHFLVQLPQTVFL